MMTTPTKPKSKQSAVAYLLASAKRIAKEAPTGELEKLPTDGAKNLDHYSVRSA